MRASRPLCVSPLPGQESIGRQSHFRKDLADAITAIGIALVERTLSAPCAVHEAAHIQAVLQAVRRAGRGIANVSRDSHWE